MKERDILISHTLDLKEKAATESVIMSTSFMSVDELSDLIRAERINNEFVDTFYYGGYEEAERKILLFVPVFYDVESDFLEDFLEENDANPLQLLKVKKDKFATLSHRDYLGALMALGLKREVIGDIIVDNEGCSIICLKSISEYIEKNLKQAGRGQLTVFPGNLNELRKKGSNSETVFVSVASLRLDCLVAAVFRLSRSSALSSIVQGIVYVNDIQLLKPDYVLKQGDKLVCRGKGKSVISEILGENKKGRIHLNIKRYL